MPVGQSRPQNRSHRRNPKDKQMGWMDALSPLIAQTPQALQLRQLLELPWRVHGTIPDMPRTKSVYAKRGMSFPNGLATLNKSICVRRLRDSEGRGVDKYYTMLF